MASGTGIAAGFAERRAPSAPTAAAPARPRIAISVNTAWNVGNFRAGLIRALVAEGWDVVAIAPHDKHADRIPGLGCRFVPLPMDNKGSNPVADAALFLRYLRLLGRERPHAYLGFTIKPNIYGSLAARLLGIPTLNNVSGLGTAFIRDSWLTRIVKVLYWLAFRRSEVVFFQNEDDRGLFLEAGLVRRERSALLPGSGIDLARFAPSPPVPERRPDRFLLVARLLYDKGVREFVDAARLVKAARPDVTFSLLGFLDADNRTAVPRAEVEGWVREGVVSYLGPADDVRPFIREADCVVLPSYREGTPRTLLEAAAMGKPVIATDVPGCREVVDHGTTGFLCRVRDADDLAARMGDFLGLTAEERRAMGAAGRRKMELQFDERLVVQAYLARLRSLLDPGASAARGSRPVAAGGAP